MTRRRISEPRTKVTMDLFTADVERMKALYPDAGYTTAVRMLIRQHLRALDRQGVAMLDTQAELDIEI